MCCAFDTVGDVRYRGRTGIRKSSLQKKRAQRVCDYRKPCVGQQVFKLFKDYLSTQLDSQKKKLESKHKIDKDTVELKYKLFHSLFFAQVSDIVFYLFYSNASYGPPNSLILQIYHRSLILLYTRYRIVAWMQACECNL